MRIDDSSCFYDFPICFDSDSRFLHLCTKWKSISLYWENVKICGQKNVYQRKIEEKLV